MRFCNIGKFFIALFLVGLGVGIILSRCLGLGYIWAIIFIALGVWKMF